MVLVSKELITYWALNCTYLTGLVAGFQTNNAWLPNGCEAALVARPSRSPCREAKHGETVLFRAVMH